MSKHAIQILIQNTAGKYVLNEEELETILTQPEVAENPVALYSVSGPFRKGKSFMLNLFLQFLCNNRNIKWKKDPEKLLDNGFSWRGGNESNTQGLLIWPKPFMVDVDGKQVAILLMDTQGTFDMNTGMQGNSLIVALSTLMSSMQIYNLQKQVNLDDLQALQLFTEFGKMAKEENQDVTAFQSLFFLIRDWADDDESYGLESGMKYLEEFLSHNEKEEIRNIAETIQTSFEDKGCFLMPEPDDTIRKRGKTNNQCAIKDIGEEFLDEVQIFMDHIFASANIPIKKVNGKEVTGVDLLNYTVSYMKQLSKDDMPQITSLFEASTTTYWMNAVRQCQKTYKQDMEKVCKEGLHITDVELAGQHFKIKQKTLELFYERRKMGEEAIAGEYKKKLESVLNKDLTLFWNINEQNLKSHILECSKIIADSNAELQIQLQKKLTQEEYLERDTCEDIFEKFKYTCKQVCVEKFKYGTTDEDSVEKLILDLEHSWTKTYNNFLTLNTESKEKYETRIKRQAITAKQLYLEQMYRKTNGNYTETEEMDKIHAEALKSAISLFDSIFTVNHPKQQVAVKIKDQLLYDISNEKIHFYHDNERQKSNLPFQALSAAKSKYLEEMNKELDKDIQSIQNLEACNEKSLKKAKSVLARMLSSCDEKTEEECGENLKNYAKKICGSFSVSFEEMDVEKCEKCKMDAFQNYITQMKEMDMMKNASDIDKFHQNNLQQAREYLKKKILERNISPDKWLQELELAIGCQYSGMKESREKEKIRKQEVENAAIQEAVTAYIRHMSLIMEGKYTIRCALVNEHVKVKSDIQNNWLSTVGYEAPDKLNTVLDDSFRKIEEENEENKDLWIRTQTKPKQDIKSEGMFTKIRKFLKQNSNDEIVTTFL